MEQLKRNYAAPAAACAAEVLLLLARSGEHLNASEISRRLDVTRSLVFRVCSELVPRGFLIRSEEGRFALGFANLETGGAVAAEVDHEARVRSVVKDLALEAQASASLAVLRGAEVMHIIREDPPEAKLAVRQLVAAIPANCSALGKALLTGLSNEEIKSRFGSGLVAMTERSVSSISSLLDEIQVARDQGYAEQREEAIQGRSAVAIPIALELLDEPAAIGIAAPCGQYEAMRENFLALLTNARRRIALENDARSALSSIRP